MVFNQLCPPALIYLIFSTTQVIIDSVKGLYNTALMKIWVAILFTILLNYLCSLGLGTISWLIVFIPFIDSSCSGFIINVWIRPINWKIKNGTTR